MKAKDLEIHRLPGDLQPFCYVLLRSDPRPLALGVARMVSELIPPDEDFADTVHNLVRMALGTTPIVGGTAAEVFNWIVTPPVQKRLAAWRKEIARRLMDLIREAEDVRAEIERLLSDEQFTSTVIEATQIAVATHSAEKLEALRNAVVNVAAGIEIGEIERSLFLRYVDELSEMHLRILAYGNGSVRPPQMGHGGWLNVGVETVLTTVFPELSANALLATILWDELADRALAVPVELNERPPVTQWRKPWTIDFGQQFLRFISEPPAEPAPTE